MSNKVIVVTGASRGIGKSCAMALSAYGVDLVLMSRNEEDLKEVSHACESLGANVYTLGLDLSSTTQIKEGITSIKSALGHIDVLVNNAGIWLEESFEDGNMDIWDNALDVNLKNTIHLTRHCVEGMPRGGAVVFIASSASRRAYAGGTNYCAAKFGLLGFAGALFEDIRERGIKVSSILPGVVNTDMHKGDPKLVPEKMIQPEDVAKCVKFIVDMPANVCPTEITLQPQQNPKTR